MRIHAANALSRVSSAQILGYLARTVAAPFYSRQRQLITVKRLDVPQATPAPGAGWDPGTTCVVVESPEAFQGFAAEIPAGFRDSVEELGKRLAAGCVVCLARRKRSDGAGHEVVGYELAERGVFSALGRRVAVSEDVIFSHYVEVVPACRGQRIHGLLFATRDAYFRGRGGRLVCGVVLPKNRASLQALARDGAVVVGAVQRRALFGGLIAWDTPLADVEAVLRACRGPRRTCAAADARARQAPAGDDPFRVAVSR